MRHCIYMCSVFIITKINFVYSETKKYGITHTHTQNSNNSNNKGITNTHRWWTTLKCYLTTCLFGTVDAILPVTVLPYTKQHLQISFASRWKKKLSDKMNKNYSKLFALNFDIHTVVYSWSHKVHHVYSCLLKSVLLFNELIFFFW